MLYDILLGTSSVLPFFRSSVPRIFGRGTRLPPRNWRGTLKRNGSLMNDKSKTEDYFS